MLPLFHLQFKPPDLPPFMYNGTTKYCIWKTLNLWTCAASSTNTKRQKKKRRWELPHRKTPYSQLTCPTAEHPTRVDLPHCGTPYSRWTFLTGEHPIHHGHAQPQNTLLTVDLSNCKTPYSPWTCPTWNTQLTKEEDLRKNPAYGRQSIS